MRLPKAVTVFFSAVLAVLALSFSIAVPILFRPFYYFQINALELPERTGWSEEIIREAYDDVLDFCVLGEPFGTGQLAWSESGRSHFADVRELFILDFWALGISAVLCGFLLVLRLWKKWVFRPLLGHGPGFWAGTIAGGCVLIVAGLAALDFDRAFVIFHAIFFPGKDNWIFDPTTDQIIQVMPEEFFCNCAILIGVIFLTCCSILVLTDLLRRKHL
ncbi:TIGR01906 family membrane protein [uncultured Flavonifractor sp.]|uniref:TIGR01906 family membrane protein n=1 Tax=uncultured Flavonifractor sp. TaxID=1193534 RepID=UPI002636E55F|nr:TIGR01906 family membrane protein [uncultured Flavonifractor sp.]